MDKSPRDVAIEAIMSGESVVVDGVQYTEANMSELPGIEAFVAGDASGEAAAIARLKSEKEELEKRLAALESKKSSAKEPEEAKAEKGKS